MHTLTLCVQPDNIPVGDAVYITGNHKVLGNWQPNGLPLERRNDGAWQAHITVPKNTRLEYKVTRGSWDSEASNEQGHALDNFHITVKKDLMRKLVIPHWKDSAAKAQEEKIASSKPEERITGNVKFHHAPEMMGLKARDIIVWLPPGYETDTDKHYPVLYMHDGQNIFDPYTAYGGVDWQADETATKLIEEKRMREIIIVGINNTHDRLDEYSYSPKGRSYRNFIIKELKPFIDSHYRTLPEREHTATAGASMGGLVSFLMLWYHSDIFGLAGCFSPSFIYGKNAAIKHIRNSKRPRQPIKFMMDCGGIGGERLLHKGCKRVKRILRNKGIKRDLDFEFHFYPEGNHTETAWGDRLWRHFEYLFPPESA